MSEAVDFSMLGRVRQALTETLQHARVCLQGYAENPTDPDCLLDCMAHLHQARGSLQMIELTAADQLTVEMEGVVDALIQARVNPREAGLEILMQALLQLPDYLSRLDNGRHEVPAVLLPIINELRAVRGIGPLSERFMFHPDLTSSLPPSVYNPDKTTGQNTVQELARNLRPRFQSGLLQWYRGAEAHQGLQELRAVLASLQQASVIEASARLWWFSGGLIESLMELGAQDSTEIKQTCGQIDRQIKRLIEVGEPAFSESIPADLLCDLLFHIIQADCSADCPVDIRQTCGITGQSAVAVGAASEGLAGRSGELLDTAATAAGAALEEIQEQLDDFIRAGMQDPAELVPIADKIHALGNSVDMIGLDEASQVLAEQGQRLRALGEGRQSVDEPLLMDVAQAMIVVETALDGIQGGEPGLVQPRGNGEYAYRHGVSAVMHAVVADMAQAKEAIDDYIRAPQQAAGLDSVAQLLDRIKGGLQLAGQERAAVLVQQIGDYVSQGLLQAAQLPTDAQLDSLADAICSIEYFVEELDRNPLYGGMVLDVAELSLARLRGEETESAVCPVVVAEVPVITEPQVIGTDVDREILDIFVEEAEETLQGLVQLIPQWSANPGDTDALESIQRAFHSLKGNGRMVGALLLGDFALAFEQLLNRLMDGAVDYSEGLDALLLDARLALVQLLAQVTGGPPAELDINDLVARAQAYPGAEILAAGQYERTVAQPVEALAAGVSGAANPLAELPVLAADADPEIVEIFLEEASEERVSIADRLPAWIGNPDNLDELEDIRRSFHTLKGSGRTAGALRIGEFAWAIEDLLKRIIDGSIEVGPDHLALLEQVPAAMSGLIAELADGSEPASDYRALMAGADSLVRGEPATPALQIPADEGAAQAGTDAAVSGPDAGDSRNDVPTLAQVEQEAEPEFIEILARECRDHLGAISAFIDTCEQAREPCMVSEPLYRALHTLSGIADSADVESIRDLAEDLYVHFAGLREAREPVSDVALGVLQACVVTMAELVGRLPDKSFDAAGLQSLRERIAGLQQDERQAGQAQPGERQKAGVDAAAAAAADPYADLDPELLEVFLEEAGEIIDSSETTLRAWSKEPGNTRLIGEFQRQLHTLKGGARMLDICAIGNLSHGIESLVTRVVDGHVGASQHLFAHLQEAHDQLANLLDQVKARKLPADIEELQAALGNFGIEADEVEVRDVVQNESREAELETCFERAPAAEPEADAVSDAEAAEQAVIQALQTDTAVEGEVMPRRVERRKSSRVRGEQVRVQASLLDDLVNNAGEMSIYRSRLEQQVGAYRFNLTELEQTTTRLRDKLRQLEIETETQILSRYEQESSDRNQDFDPLEMDRYSNLQQLSRSLMESISDLHSIQELLAGTTREAETLLLQQSRVNTSLQEDLLRTRMIPFAGLAPRLRRVVRQSAQELGKQVELRLEGAESEMDRTLVDRIVAPLEHMLRNAVDHGIEMPGERKKAGKPETGTIKIALHREGPEIVLRIADDGKGLNRDAIHERAVERGLIADASDLSDFEIMQFILQTGFSTANEVTQLSGRGVGMDVVNSEVKQLGGSLLIESSPGVGSVFTVRLPYTLALNQALLVKAGDDTYCIPLGGIEGVTRVGAEELAACYEMPGTTFEYAGNHYQLQHLATLLNRRTMDLASLQGRVPVLLTRIGGKRIALQVEALIGNREIVVKPLGVQLSTVNGVSGATILGDGRVVLILDLAAVVRAGSRPRSVGRVSRDGGRGKLVVMVVDDSITVRKVTTRLLERQGFSVVTARDGLDAISQLQECVPDIMLLDIEMPRMDGFELASHMRNEERFRHIPITMVTSRTGDKHRERAAQIGVNEYLGKPYQEHQLLNTIQRLIGMPVMDREALSG
ncbi:MAG: Hpt domain-containing protein [Gammaproteobacteria bacterium]|nr:Hpt domain-containing protein [Gammaproteobacteria bacterium]